MSNAIENVHTTIDAYKRLIERAADEMLKIYSYAPRGFEDLMQGDLSIGNESDILLRQAALLETGQSTETRLIQSKTSSILTSNARGDASTHITSLVGASFIKVTGVTLYLMSLKLKHIETTMDGLFIHHLMPSTVAVSVWSFLDLIGALLEKNQSTNHYILLQLKQLKFY